MPKTTVLFLKQYQWYWRISTNFLSTMETFDKFCCGITCWNIHINMQQVHTYVDMSTSGDDSTLGTLTSLCPCFVRCYFHNVHNSSGEKCENNKGNSWLLLLFPSQIPPSQVDSSIILLFTHALISSLSDVLWMVVGAYRGAALAPELN